MWVGRHPLWRDSKTGLASSPVEAESHGVLTVGVRQDRTTQCYMRHMAKAEYANVDIDEIDDGIKEAYKLIRDALRWRRDLPHANIYNSCVCDARKLMVFINECIKSGTYPDTKYKSKFLPKVCVCYRNISKGMYKVKLPCDK